MNANHSYGGFSCFDLHYAAALTRAEQDGRAMRHAAEDARNIREGERVAQLDRSMNPFRGVLD